MAINLSGILLPITTPFTVGEDFDADRKSTRLNSSHGYISYAVFCLKKKKLHSHVPSIVAAHGSSENILRLCRGSFSELRRTASLCPECMRILCQCQSNSALLHRSA